MGSSNPFKRSLSDFFSGNERFRKKMEPYKFSMEKIFKIAPTGNYMQGTVCPKPRSGHRIIYRHGNIYAFGGYASIVYNDDPRPVIFNELWKYNCASKTWKLLETTGKMPETLASHCVALANNCMLVFGGTGAEFGHALSDSTHVCNLDTLEWTTLDTTGTHPSPQYGQAMLVHENKMYVTGGTTGHTYSMDVHCLDLESRKWKKLDSDAVFHGDDPLPRYRHEIAIYENQIFVFGGGMANDSYELKQLPVFNLNTNRWSEVTTTGELPAKRRCHALVQMGSDIYMCGGLDGDLSGEGNPAALFSDVWKINLNTLRWEKLSTVLPTSLYFHSAALSESGQMFIFGGVNSTNSTRTNEMLSMWLRMPSLAEMSWNALIKFAPSVASSSAKKLYGMGIPLHFVMEIDFEPSDSMKISNCCNRIQS